jgi:lactate racemase
MGGSLGKGEVSTSGRGISERRWAVRRSGDEHVYIDHGFGEARWMAGDVRHRLVMVPEVAAAPADVIAQAVHHPVGSAPLSEIAVGCRTVAIITSDATRAVPCAELLDVVVPELTAAGVELGNITLVVAVGAHRGATAGEMLAFMGHWAGRIKAESHNAHEPCGLASVGSTSVGEVEVNRTVVSADLRLAFGQVEPHEFAGFSGGPKSVLAGVSGAATISRNHSPRMLFHRAARPGITSGNPIWEDMLGAAELVGLHFIVNVVVNGEGRVAAARAGGLREAHAAAIEDYQRLYTVGSLALGSESVLVVTPGSPLDINLYQSLKAVVAAEALVRDGGVVLLYSHCPEGVGHSDFSRAFEVAGSASRVPALLSDGAFYTAPMDHALLLAKLLTERRLRIVLCAPGVPDQTAAAMGLMVEGTLQSAFDKCLALVGHEARPVDVTFFPCPQKVVLSPRVAGVA